MNDSSDIAREVQGDANFATFEPVAGAGGPAACRNDRSNPARRTEDRLRHPAIRYRTPRTELAEAVQVVSN